MKIIKASVFQKLKTYYLSHIWCSFVFVFLVLVIFTFIVIQGYLKQEYKKYLKDKTYSTENVVLSSINQNLNLIIKEFIQIAAEISNDDYLYKQVEAYELQGLNSPRIRRDITNALGRYSQYSSWIENICIVSDKGMLLQYDRKNYTNYKLWNEENMDLLYRLNARLFALLKQNPMHKYKASGCNLAHPGDDSLYVFHITVPLKGDKTFESVTHSVVISFNSEVLGKFLDTVHQDSEDLAVGYLTGEDDIILYHKDRNYIGMRREEYLSRENLQNISASIDKAGWAVNIAIDEMKMKHQVDVIYSRGTVFYLIILFLMLVFMCLVNILVLKPVNAINQSILKVKKGNLNHKIVIEGYNEIWKLAEEYNNMIDSLKEMNHQIEKQHQDKLISMKKQQRAEREALESQINAHFICNTLGAINYEVMEAGNHKVSVLIKKLSNILRYTFDQKHQNVYFFQELAWIEQYLYLQKFRLGDVFDYEIDFPEVCESWPCRKLMLEPFVENSILHGFEGRQEGGRILIRGETADRRLKLTIEDNGWGMEEGREAVIQNIIKNPLEAGKEKVGIGISNVVTRMRMYYGKADDSAMDIILTTKPGVGTKFVFYLPMMSQKEEEEHACDDCGR